MGLGELSLRDVTAYSGFDFDAQINFKRFGSKAVQDFVRAGLIDIPSLKWQYLVTVHRVLGLGNNWYEVEGATEIHIPTAKSFHDRGVVFIDVSEDGVWNARHVAGAVHLSWVRTEDPRFNKATLREVAGYDDEIVIYTDYVGDGVYTTPSWETAKAVAWGYRKVYHFVGGAKGWEDAGYPVESGQ